MLRRLVDSHYLLWLLLAFPGAVALIGYLNGKLFYGEVMHLTGELSARLLIVALAVTPLRLMFPGRGELAGYPLSSANAASPRRLTLFTLAAARFSRRRRTHRLSKRQAILRRA